MRSVAESAEATVTVSLAHTVLPPWARTRARALKLSAPLTPGASPLVPIMSNVGGFRVVTVAFCGVFISALKVILPGWLAVRCTTITWSMGLWRTSSRV